MNFKDIFIDKKFPLIFKGIAAQNASFRKSYTVSTADFSDCRVMVFDWAEPKKEGQFLWLWVELDWHLLEPKLS